MHNSFSVTIFPLALFFFSALFYSLSQKNNMRANRWEMRAVGAVVIVLGLVQVYTSWMLLPDHYPRSARSHHSFRLEANTSLQIENIMTDLSALKAELHQLRVHAEQERRATSLQLAAALNNSHSAITQIHVLREANIRMNDQLERFVNASREATSTSTFSTILSKVFNKKSMIEIQHEHQHGANTSSSWLSLSKSQPLGSYHAGNSSIGNWLQAYARGPRSISPLKVSFVRLSET